LASTAGKILAGVGALVSLALLGLLLFGEVPLCPFCLLANGLNLAALVFVMRWRGEGLVRPPAIVYGITILVCVPLYAWMYTSMTTPPDRGATVAAYEATELVEIPVSPEDPVLGPAAAMVHLIVFSDALCPHCKRFWEMLRRVVDGYGDDVRITFKHFPLDSVCNPSVKKTMHEHACTAARALEAARLQDGFWRYDEVLKAPAQADRKKTFRNVAEDAGLDVARFTEDFNGEAVQARIRNDIEIGMRLNLTATPDVFVNGRRVQPPSPEVLKQVLDHVTGR
jgi:protein-disulfide isomerase